MSILASTESGTFTQTGGTNTATYIKVGSSGTYTLSGGTLNIKGSIYNQGIWDLLNSSAVINASSSFLDLTGHKLINAGNVSINLDSHSLLIVPADFDPKHFFTDYSNAGLVHENGSTLNISSTNSIYGQGMINGHIFCKGRY